MSISTPAWVKDAIFYQIFPDRFARSPRARSIPGTTFKPWGTPPEEQGFQGGNLLGIVDKLDYLQELGVNALYLNPIFSSASNHRYHTYDFMQVDPLLGGNEDFRRLLDAAHARQMYVVIDGVFNHASRGFWAFHHILETGGNSPYLDWFFVYNWPLRPYQHDDENPINYAAWWDIPALPKFNTDNPGVREYLMDVSRHWIEFGADGWRLDVPEEIPDPAFWQMFRQITKAANPNAYLVGEIWREASEWLQGDRFDGVMNYLFSRNALGFFAQETLQTDYQPGGFALEVLDAATFAARMEALLKSHPWEITLTQLNLLDSHDTARTLWMVDGDERALRLSVLLQMTLPGAPCIYYGSEIGMTGSHDPGCRGAFPWDEESEWNKPLHDFYRRATGLRKRFAALRTGSFETLYAQDDIYAFARELEGDVLIVLFNAGKKEARIDLPLGTLASKGGRFQAVWNSGRYVAEQGHLLSVALPARDALVLRRG
ncbi:MAG: alpha-glucosidase C-terminal domain-containing protein [Caldilineaceae bacterium]|nr:alpha-glucosidase C-terminal domain-containing protein [Caldilineaceae bacterium]